MVAHGLPNRYTFLECAVITGLWSVRDPRNQGSVISVTPSVSTFVAQFASHCGVVCDFAADSRVLLHLLFNPRTRK